MAFLMAFGALILASPALEGASGSPPLATDYQVESRQTKDGLPQNSITAVAQTPDGYLWLGTFGGLARFDGVQFTVLNPANTPGMGGGRVVGLETDRHGALWMLSEDHQAGRLADGFFQSVNGRWGLPEGGLTGLCVDPDGNVWVRGLDGVAWYRHTPAGFVLAEEVGVTFRADEREAVTFTGTRSAWLRRGGQWRVVSTEVVGTAWRAGGWMRPRPFQHRRERGYWILDADRVRASTGEEIRALTPPFRTEFEVTDLVADAEGNIWVGTWGQGLFQIQPSGQVVRIPLEAPGQTGGPKESEPIRNLFIDAEGSVWVGTDTSGLLRVSRQDFRTYGQREGLRNSVVKSVWEGDDGRVWAVHGLGIDAVRPDGVVENGWAMIGLWTGARADDGRVWLGTYSGGLFHGEDGKFVPGNPPAGLLGIMVLAPRHAGGLWVGAHAGLARVVGTNVVAEELPRGLASYDVRAIADDGRTLSIGLNGGGVLRRTGSTWRLFTRTNGLPDDHVFSLLAGTNGVLWVGTAYGGLCRLEEGRLFHFDPAEFPLPTQVSGLVEDGLGHLWLGSAVGVFRVRLADLAAAAAGRRQTFSARRYGIRDGLGTSECAASMQPTVCRGRDGRLWFATINGVSVVDPARVSGNRRPPPVVIQEVRLDEKTVETGGRLGWTDGGNGTEEDQQMLTVPSGNHRILIQYAGLSFAAPERVLFKYRLEGLDPDWVHVGGRRAAYYQGLGPGRYRFRVAGCNEDGVWNEEGAVLSFVVLRAFWQTWWFALVIVVAAGGLVAMGYRVRLRRLRELDRMRLRIASDLHDEIGGNLGSIAINCELLQSIPNLSQEERQDLASVNRVAVQTAQAVRDIVWFINPDFDNSADMLARMRDTASVMLAGRDCDFDGEGTGVFPLSLEFRRHVFALFKELLHNIVKHSRASRVEIRVAINARELRLTVQDNGRGFDPAKVQGGHGVKSLQWRARELSARFNIQSQPGEGARFELVAPLH